MTTKQISVQQAYSITDRKGKQIAATIWADQVEKLLMMENPLFHAGFIKFYSGENAGTIEIPTPRKIVLGDHSDAAARTPANFGAEITRLYLDTEISKTAKLTLTDSHIRKDANTLKGASLAHWTNQQMRIVSVLAYKKIKETILDKTKWEVAANAATGQEAIVAGNAAGQFNPTFKMDPENEADWPENTPAKLIKFLMKLKIPINRLIDLFVSGIPNEEICMFVSEEVFQQILASEALISHDVTYVKDFKQGQAIKYQGITIYSDILIGHNWKTGTLYQGKAFDLSDSQIFVMVRNSFYAAVGYTEIWEERDVYTHDYISAIRFNTGNAFPTFKIKQHRLGLKSGKKAY